MKSTRKTNRITKLLLVSSGLLWGFPASSQVHAPWQYRQPWLHAPSEQLTQGHYTLAAHSARTYLEKDAGYLMPGASFSETEKAHYLRVIALLRSNTAGADESALKLFSEIANPAYRQRIATAVARYYFSLNRLSEAIPWYERAGINNLNNREITDTKFELAYCYFNVKEFEKAAALFGTIKEIEGKYYNAGNYYYALLAYNQGDYTNALKSFRRISERQEYNTIVPYYIAEIHYFMGNREEALSEALRLINRPEKLYYHTELHLLAAQCYFEKEQYREAVTYFEYYYKHSDRIRKEELYELAYSYYRLQEYENAIRHFKQLSNTPDALGQTAMYLLGDCYLKTGDKQSARNAFAICAGMEDNRDLQKASLFLAGKLAYESAFQDEAMRHFRNLLRLYPEASFAGEARTLLSDLLTRTHNYEEAYNTLQGEGQKNNPTYQETFQKVYYGYGMQQLQNGNYEAARELFEKAMTYHARHDYRMATSFWLSELSYRLEDYESALRHGEVFITGIGSAPEIARISTQATPEHAWMNMGYASMKLERFDAAREYFQKAQFTPGTHSANAVLREADAAFMQRDFNRAASLYDQSLSAEGAADADYAVFQKAVLTGLQGKNREKISLLQELINKKPASAYQQDARYELAVTHIDAGNWKPALDAMEPILSGNESRKKPAALLKAGFAWQELKEPARAASMYRQLITDFPASPERTSALDALKNLYIQQNEPHQYAAFLREQGLSEEDNRGLDSTWYAAAETQYASGNYASAGEAMQTYLKEYPNGIFSLNAHFYNAEILLRQGKAAEALHSYEQVLAHPWSDFSEASAGKAAEIAYRSGDYEKAALHYEALRSHAMDQHNLAIAYRGIMSSRFQLQRPEEAIHYADTLLSLPGISEKEAADARFYKAKSLLALGGQTDSAARIFSSLTTNTDRTIAAESGYRLAAIYLDQGKLKEAETEAGKVLKNSGGQDFWVVKTYILLGDILSRQKDYFNAKATLRSVVKNTKIEELKQEASRKLEEVTALEKKQSKLEE